MPKHTTRKRTHLPAPRLPRSVYSAVEQVAEILAHPEAFPDACELIGHILCEMSTVTQVSVEHPDLLRPFLLACARVKGKGVDDSFGELHQACHFAGQPAAVRELSARLGYTDPDETDAPAGNVVDLGLWRQSHPRKITRPVFAEKGGDDE